MKTDPDQGFLLCPCLWCVLVRETVVRETLFKVTSFLNWIHTQKTLEGKYYYNVCSLTV